MESNRCQQRDNRQDADDELNACIDFSNVHGKPDENSGEPPGVRRPLGDVLIHNAPLSALPH